MLVTYWVVPAVKAMVAPLVSARIFERWFGLPQLLWLAPIPLATAGLLVCAAHDLRARPQGAPAASWRPFACAAGLFLLAFAGLAYSLFPYLLVDRLTIWEAASARESLWFIFFGTAVALPAILGYTIYSSRVFHGRAEDLSYD